MGAIRERGRWVIKKAEDMSHVVSAFLSSPITSQSPHDGRYPLLPQETGLVHAHWWCFIHRSSLGKAWMYSESLETLWAANAKAWDVSADCLGPGMNGHCYRLIIVEQIFATKSNITHLKEQVLLNLKFLLQVISRPCYCSRQNDLLKPGYTMSISWTSLFEIGLGYVFPEIFGLRQTFSMEIFILNG